MSMTIAATNDTPTYEGETRYPPTGYYEGYACTCTEDCRFNCKGECGCKACKTCYSDFLSTE